MNCCSGKVRGIIISLLLDGALSILTLQSMQAAGLGFVVYVCENYTNFFMYYIKYSMFSIDSSV